MNTSHTRIIRSLIGAALLCAGLWVALASIPAARADEDIQPPALPPACGTLQVQPGNEVAFHAYAIGVQVYKWNGTEWGLDRPEATLYSDPNYRGKVGTHYKGPTWESNTGSYVIGKQPRLAGCSVDSTAVDWLLLQAAATQGPGVFGGVTYIQRVNTTGGLAPSTPGTMMDESREVPYTAEYYFYRAE